MDLDVAVTDLGIVVLLPSEVSDRASLLSVAEILESMVRDVIGVLRVVRLRPDRVLVIRRPVRFIALVPFVVSEVRSRLVRLSFLYIGLASVLIVLSVRSRMLSVVVSVVRSVTLETRLLLVL